MKHTIIEKAALKAKSEETGIPFSNLLAGYVLEELMYLIEDSPFSLFLWLKNSGARGGTVPEEKSVDAGFCLCDRSTHYEAGGDRSGAGTVS